MTAIDRDWLAVLSGDQPQLLYRGLVCMVAHDDGWTGVVTADDSTVAATDWPAIAVLIARAPAMRRALTRTLAMAAAMDAGGIVEDDYQSWLAEIRALLAAEEGPCPTARS